MTTPLDITLAKFDENWHLTPVSISGTVAPSHEGYRNLAEYPLFFFLGAVEDIPGMTFTSIASGLAHVMPDAWTSILSQMNGFTNTGLTFVQGNFTELPEKIQTKVNTFETAISAQADWNQSNSSATDYIKNKPSIPSVPSRSFATPSRTSGTAFQISTTRDAQVMYSAPISCAATLLLGAGGAMSLQYADNSGMSTNVVTLPGDAFGLPTGLVASANSTLKTGGIIPAGKWVRVTNSNVTGTPTIGSISAQEVLI